MKKDERDTIPKPGGLGSREPARVLRCSAFVRFLFGNFPVDVRPACTTLEADSRDEEVPLERQVSSHSRCLTGKTAALALGTVQRIDRRAAASPADLS
jgi:hypothetical protein